MMLRLLAFAAISLTLSFIDFILPFSLFFDFLRHYFRHFHSMPPPRRHVCRRYIILPPSFFAFVDAIRCHLPLRRQQRYLMLLSPRAELMPAML